MGDVVSNMVEPEQNGNNTILDWQKVFLSLVLAVALIILIANGLVIVAYIKDHKLRTAANFFLINLVIADLFVGICIPIHIGLLMVIRQTPTKVHCAVYLSSIALPLGVSSLSLLLVTIERFITIHCPFEYQRKMTYLVGLGVAFVAWLIPAATVIALLITWQPGSKNHEVCSEMIQIPSYFHRYVMAPWILLISGVTTGLYVKILALAHTQIQRIHLLVVQVSPCDKRKIHNIKLAKTGFIILGVFLTCWLPLPVITIAAQVLDQNLLIQQIYHCTVYLPALSSMLNPFIYAARIHRVKIQMKRLFNISMASSDRFENYEIRQSFSVRKYDAIGDTFRAGSLFPEVNEAYEKDYHEENVTIDFKKQFMKERSLSRISESPELRSISINDDLEQTDYSNESKAIDDECFDHDSMTPIWNELECRSAAEYINKDSILAKKQKNPIENDDKSGIRAEKGETSSRDASENTITVDCDSDTQYIKVVVKRLVRCESIEETEGKEVPKLKKLSMKSQAIFIDNEWTPTEEVRQEQASSSPKNKTSTERSQSTLRKSVKKTHRRSASTCSETSIFCDNDKIHIQVISNQKLKRQLAPSSPTQLMPYGSMDRSNRVNNDLDIENLPFSKKKEAENFGTIRSLVQDTLKRISKSYTQKGQLEETSNNKLTSAEEGNRISHKRSRSTEDPGTNPPTVVHQRSKSANFGHTQNPPTAKKDLDIVAEKCFIDLYQTKMKIHSATEQIKNSDIVFPIKLRLKAGPEGDSDNLNSQNETRRKSFLVNSKQDDHTFQFKLNL